MAILSEDIILACIDRHFGYSRPAVSLGRGDDCAILAGVSPICVSTDLFLEDIHFRKSYFSPEDIGYKSLAVNISDLAAMGAKPLAFQLGLGVPPWADISWLEQFFQGMAELAVAEGIVLSGGDLTASSRLHISITVFGECMEGCTLLRRGGSMPGDKLFLIGNLGLARVGLGVLEAMGKPAIEEWPAACKAHLRPQPQTAAGLMLARAAYNSRPPALMDVSDGLVRDLPRLLGLKAGNRELGANFNLSRTFLHPELEKYCRQSGLDPCLEACLGGEDYALLGTCAPDMIHALKAAIPGFMCIGEVISENRFYCNEQDITDLGGFDHFGNAQE